MLIGTEHTSYNLSFLLFNKWLHGLLRGDKLPPAAYYFFSPLFFRNLSSGQFPPMWGLSSSYTHILSLVPSPAYTGYWSSSFMSCYAWPSNILVAILEDVASSFNSHYASHITDHILLVYISVTLLD